MPAVRRPRPCREAGFDPSRRTSRRGTAGSHNRRRFAPMSPRRPALLLGRSQPSLSDYGSPSCRSGVRKIRPEEIRPSMRPSMRPPVRALRASMRSSIITSPHAYPRPPMRTSMRPNVPRCALPRDSLDTFRRPSLSPSPHSNVPPTSEGTKEPTTHNRDPPRGMFLTVRLSAPWYVRPPCKQKLDRTYGTFAAPHLNPFTPTQRLHR